MVGGSVPSEGRVELFYEGEWGRVPYYQMNNSLAAVIATVACRQLGYPNGNLTDSFGEGSGTVWTIVHSCTGMEERLEQCQHCGWQYISCICPDLGVTCGRECVCLFVCTCVIL